jgi:hypothetical protein
VRESGTLAALSSSSITVTDGGTSLTCPIGQSSTSTTGFTVGESVRIYCLPDGGALESIFANTNTTTTITPSYASINGTLAALSSSSITATSGSTSLTCTIGSSSPSTNGYSVGQSVRMYCTSGGGPLVAIYANATPPTTTTPPASGITTTGQGTVTALGATSITVDTIRTGPLTCSLTSSSPSTSGFTVGDYVGLGCGNGVLLVLVPKSGDDSSSPVDAEDEISALTPTAITVGPLTCTVTSTSPSLTGFTIGERVGIQCAGGVLTGIKALSSPTMPLTAQGPITALSLTSITVGPLTCTVGSASPSLTGYALGEQATIGCLDGVLGKIAVAPKLAFQIGVIDLLSASSITVRSLTCTFDTSSPSLTGYNLGDRVGMVCLDGILGLIVPLNGELTGNTTRKTATIRHDLLMRYSACVKHPGKRGCHKATIRLQRATRR